MWLGEATREEDAADIPRRSSGIVFMLIERYLAATRRQLPQTMAMLLDFIPESLAMGGMFAFGSPLAPLLALLIGIIIGNIIAGSDDHGVVLRDKCSPIVMNNLIYDCSSGGILQRLLRPPAQPLHHFRRQRHTCAGVCLCAGHCRTGLLQLG